MKNWAILVTLALLTSVTLVPYSYAEDISEREPTKAKHEQARDAFDQTRADRLEAQKQSAADVKAKMQAKKMQAGKAIEESIAARESKIKNEDIPRAADLLDQVHQNAKAAIDARKSSGGPSDSQTDLESQRENFAMKVKSQKENLKKAPAKDVKVTIDVGHKVPKTQKEIGATDQNAKEAAQKAEADKAAEIAKKMYGSIHYNRK